MLRFSGRGQNLVGSALRELGKGADVLESSIPKQTALQGGQRELCGLYTAPVVATPGHLEREIEKARRLLHHAAIDRARRYEHLG
jgi:hypothetical protein